MKQGRVKKVAEEEKNNIEDVLEIESDGSINVDISEDDEEEEK